MSSLYLKLIGQIENMPEPKTRKSGISESIIRDVTRGMNLDTGSDLKSFLTKHKTLTKK